MAVSTYAIVFGCLTLIYIGKQFLGSARSKFPLPPGPSGLPWVGNVIGIDTNAPWLTYRKWAKKHGKFSCDIVYCQLLGKDIIIINSENVARDLLDRHSSNNSDRPYFITNELCGIDFNTVLLPYGDRWRLHKRFFQQSFRLNAVKRFIPFQHRKVCQFLQRLITVPDRLDDHIFEYTASIVLNSAYDYDPPSHEDELIKMVSKVLEVSLAVVRPDIAIIVATFPFVLNLPSWFPGMSFKKDMEVAKQLTNAYVETAFEYSLRKMRDGSVHMAPSMVQDAFKNLNSKGTVPDELWMKGLKEAAATAFLAASETSHSVLLAFFLMMTLNPAAQEKAQAQIDAVVGNDRLPTTDDRPSLPYIDAILRETLRYSPATPLSVPHVAVDDDEYQGLHIPKGAMLLANVWAMTHDEARYPDPDVFRPERFLNEDGSLKAKETEDVVFGFGRRICPGRHFADLSIWSVIANVLTVFKILKPLDENGAEISIEPKFTSGLIIHPVPFKCRIMPRSPGMGTIKLEELIAAGRH